MTETKVKTSPLSIFGQPKMLVLLLLGFSSGLPLFLTSRTLQAWMTKADVNLTTIGLFSMVALPYSLKFLWAPILDRYVPPFLGRRRGWLVITQALLLLSIAAMSLHNPRLGLQALAINATVDCVLQREPGHRGRCVPRRHPPGAGDGCRRRRLRDRISHCLDRRRIDRARSRRPNAVASGVSPPLAADAGGNGHRVFRAGACAARRTAANDRRGGGASVQGFLRAEWACSPVRSFSSSS